MQNIIKSTPDGENSVSSWVLLLILVGYVISSLFLFSFIGYAAVLPFFGFDIAQMTDALQHPFANEQAKVPMMILQGIISIGGFIVAPWFFVRYHLKMGHQSFIELPKPVIHPIIMTAILVFCFMIVNSILIEWNQNFVFPESLSYLEELARDLEDRAEEMTKYLTTFDSIPYFLLALVVVAVVPAVGEELLFRIYFIVF
jgi:hypothetical protein